MPQQRQRIVFCDCLDCVEQPATTDIASSTSPANEAAARQEPPPKCLMFVLSGVLLPQPGAANPGTATVLDSCSIPHLNRAAAQGNLCLLSLREEAGAAADSCAELEQVFCMYQERQEGKPPVTLADRFKGLLASFSSNSSAAQAVAAAVGMSSSSVLQPPSHTQAADGGDGDGGGVLDPQLKGAGRGKHGSSAAADGSSTADVVSRALPDPAEAARRILEELGLQQADAGLDLLAVHLDLHTLQQQQQQQGTASPAPGSSSPAAAAAAAAVLGWLDKTLRYLNNSSAFKDAVLLTVLATPGSSQQAAPIPLLAAAGGDELSATTAAESGAPQQEQQQQQTRRVLRPLQSFQQLAGKPLAVSRQRAVLCLRRLPGVIRRDACSRFSLADCCSSSGTLAVLADRLLPEVAYKLGRAPKYGA